MNSFLDVDGLKRIGLKKFGHNVLISKFAQFYSADTIEIGDNVRIDDFCILSGKIVLGNNIHVSAFCGFFAGDVGIGIGDYSTISARGLIYAISDDYSGAYMTNPMVPDEYRNVCKKKVVIGENVIIGAGTTVLPGVTIQDGVAVGSMSLIKNDLSEWGIYAGVPCQKIKDRENGLLRFLDKIDM